MSIIGSGHALLLASAAAAPVVTGISRSLRFNKSDSAHLSRTPTSAGNRKTWTWSGWVKRSKIGITRYALFVAGTGGNDQTQIFFEQATGLDKLHFYHQQGGAYAGQCLTTAVYRDPSAWYHIVLAVDTTQATASNRAKIYINGVQQDTTFYSNFTQNADLYVNATNAHAIGYDVTNAGSGQTYYFDGYLADVHFVDGQALDPTSFGEFDATTGVWNPIEVTGLSYGTNGFHLTFGDNSGTSSTTLGKDAAGSNNWTPNNFSVASGSGNDSLVDVPRNGSETDTGVGGEVRGNYCTLNPLSSASSTLTNGNLDFAYLSAGNKGAYGTIGLSSGKWYWEVTMRSSGNVDCQVGIVKEAGYSTSNYVGSNANGWGYDANGNKYNNGSGTSYGASYTNGNVIGVAFDADNGTLTFYKNNTSQGQAYSGLTAGPYFPAVSVYNSELYVNFGARAFSYSAPSGFKALCTTNLTDPTITDPSDYMDVALWTGNGSTQTISGLGFSPDFVWIKNRSAGDYHRLNDIIRGANNHLFSNTADGEVVNDANGYLSAFTSDGFSLTSGTGVNASSNAYVGWTWDAGSSTVSNTDGSISSQVRANASAGFSIVTYTGTGSAATVGHGLGVAPQMIIVKSRSNVMDWGVYHISTGNAAYLKLNTTGSTQGFNAWNSTSPTSTVFSIGNIGETNTNTYTYVAYCFAPVAGYSAFGSYTGNGSSDGPFIYTGFDVKFILLKQSSASGERWYIQDIARDINANDAALYPNSSDAEFSSTSYAIDFLSNGFKLRNTNASHNSSGSTYVYACFAESPFKYARAR